MKLRRASLRRERERETERQRDRETGRERAKELRLATNPNPPFFASQSTGIKPGVVVHACNPSTFLCFFAVPGIECRGVLPPRYTPALFFYTLF